MSANRSRISGAFLSMVTVLAVLSGEVRYAVDGARMRLTGADGVTGLGYTAR